MQKDDCRLSAFHDCHAAVRSTQVNTNNFSHDLFPPSFNLLLLPFGTVEEEDRNDSFVQGMEMVYKKLMAALENIGVKPIEAVGKEFDPA